MNLDYPIVLVTGANGWLGRALVAGLTHGLPDWPELARPVQGLQIRCLLAPGEDPSYLRSLAPSAEIVFGDLSHRDGARELCRAADGAILYHLAGIIHPRRVRDFYRVNVEGTRHLLDAACAVRRVVAVSSNSVAGCNATPADRFDESAPYAPYQHYGRSKLAFERLVIDRAATGAVEAIIIRPVWYYGPHQPPRQTLFFQMIRDGRAPILGRGENRRSMAYVDNVVQSLIGAARAPSATGQVYWIADEHPYTMNEIVATVEQLLETEYGVPCARKRLRLPAATGTVAWLADSMIQAVGLYDQRVHVLSEMGMTIACRVDKARREIGYEPKISLEEGMRRSLRWLAGRPDLAPAIFGRRSTGGLEG